ncbi:MAG: CsgG/HfaB family protein, partial [Muribaculaceae bacterium]|nr:CsgG/HfaB family protein [Muribaculaceae bacterium]
MKRLLSLILLIAALVPAVALAQDHRQRLAILDPVMSDSDDGMKLVVREIVSSVFVNNGEKYTILERSLLDKVMQEAKFSNTGAVDEAQATELGKLAGADKIVLTVVSKVGTRCMLSIKLINVETATIEKQHSKVVKYESLLDVIEPLTLAVLGKASDDQLAAVDTPEQTAAAAPAAAPAPAP